ncbi:MAG: hypothetical protein IJH42_09095 [Atopobiaceae bacterium]|nr:hypothetical protein [Atopobiaceae bacterium]
MRRALVGLVRGCRWLWGRVCELVGLLACIALVLLLLPLVPVFRMLEDIGEALRDD